MASKIPAKSILKQKPTDSKPTLSDEQKQKAERDRRNLGIALHHANKIQARKDVEALILSNIETLLEYPSGPSYTPAEAAEFVSSIKIFQPSNFDSLVEERSIDGKCGYALCANSPRSVTLGSSASWKLKGQGTGDYCSNDCFRKALYVKTQLSEVPAWERQSGQQPQITLYENYTTAIDSTPSRQLSTADDRELALERGEKAGSFRPNQVMADSVVEKTNTSYKPPTMISSSSPYNSIEGHVPMQKLKGAPDASTVVELDNKDHVVAGSNSKGTIKSEEDESWNALFENLSKRSSGSQRIENGQVQML